MSSFVYILSNKPNGTLYVGVTNDLVRRVHEHKSGFVEGFSKIYDIKMLVYYEVVDTIEVGIQREKKLKRWRRAWKIKLIEEMNPKWRDLYSTIL